MIDTIKGEIPFSDVQDFPKRFHEVEQAVQILKSYKAFGNALKDYDRNKDLEIDLLS